MNVTSVDDIVAVQVVDSGQDLLNSLGGILLRELALFANAIEQLSASSELRYNVVFVPRLEPVHEANDVGMLEALEHVQLVVYHSLVALDILLQNDLDGHLSRRSICLSHDTVGACTECFSESVFSLLVIALRLALEPTEHSCNCRQID